MTPEEKVLEKFRRVLIDDETIRGYVQARVYAQHISSVQGPVFPAISMTVVGVPRFAAMDVSDMAVQIDFWFSSKTHQTDDIRACHRAAKALLHRQNLTDAGIGLVAHVCHETGNGPMMFEQDTLLHHYPARYRVVAL